VPVPLNRRIGGTLAVCASIDAVGALLAAGFENAEDPQPMKVIGTTIATAIRMMHRNAPAEKNVKRIKASLIFYLDGNPGAAKHRHLIFKVTPRPCRRFYSPYSIRKDTEVHGYMASGCHLVITHGNGPQVGAQLLRSLGAGIGSGSRADSRRLWRLPSGRDWHLLSQSLQTELFVPD